MKKIIPVFLLLALMVVTTGGAVMDSKDTNFKVEEIPLGTGYKTEFIPLGKEYKADFLP